MKGGYTDTNKNRQDVKNIFKQLLKLNKIKYNTPLIINGKISKNVKFLHPDKIKNLSPILQKIPNLFLIEKIQDKTFTFQLMVILFQYL